MANATKVAIIGDELIWSNLNRLTAALRDKGLKKALRRASVPIEASAKGHCRKDTGNLADSIQTRITSKGSKGQLIRSFIGPETNRRIPIIRHKAGLGLPYEIDIPTRRAHLEEFGHNIVTKEGVIVGYAPGQAFMRPAWDEYGGENALYTFCDEAQKFITEETAKLPQGVAP